MRQRTSPLALLIQVAHQVAVKHAGSDDRDALEKAYDDLVTDEIAERALDDLAELEAKYVELIQSIPGDTANAEQMVEIESLAARVREARSVAALATTIASAEMLEKLIDCVEALVPHVHKPEPDPQPATDPS